MKTDMLAAIVITGVFALALTAGALTPLSVKQSFVRSTESYLSPINQTFEEMTSKGKAGYVVLGLYVFILYNNLRVAVANLLLGFTIIIPVAIIGFNGYVIGAFLTYGDIIRNAILLLPHGIVEVTGIIYSAILGLRVGIESLKKLRKMKSDIRYAISSSFKNFK
jgi:uncharacterized membrane protein SpoIIM required for sporulation